MNTLQRPILGSRARQGVAAVLRWVADRLRDETVIPVEPAGLAARERVVTPTPPPVEPVTPTAPSPEAIAPASIAQPPEPEPVAPGSDEDERIRTRVVDALHTIFDPEIPVDIYELGLIYAVDVRPDRTVNIRMTLTSPNCPAAQSLPSEVEVKASAVEGVDRADVEVVFDPPWTPDLMSDEARLELNIG